MSNINDAPPTGSWRKNVTVKFSSLVEKWGLYPWGMFGWGDKGNETSATWKKTKL